MIDCTSRQESAERGRIEENLMRTENVHVLIPARNEEQLLPDALHAVRSALDWAEKVLAGPITPDSRGCALDIGPWQPRRLSTRLTVIADLCTDRTAAVAAELADDVIVISSGSPGVARAAGLPLDRPEGLWAETADALLMCTDADSVVPVEWVFEHLRHRWAGADAIAGIVSVQDWSSRPQALRHRFEQGYAERAGHVHGANLGISSAAYREVGGFAALEVGEDQNLVDRLHCAGFQVHECLSLPVATSGRAQSRVAAGFAHYLNTAQAAL